MTDLLAQIKWASQILTDTDAKSLLKDECKALIEYVEHLEAKVEALSDATRAAQIFVSPLERLKFKDDDYKKDAARRISEALKLIS